MHENGILVGYYTASGGNSLLTFWDGLLVPSSRVKNLKRKPVSLVWGLYREE